MTMLVLRQIFGFSTSIRVLAIFILLWSVLILTFACIRLNGSNQSALTDADHKDQQLKDAITLLEETKQRNFQLEQFMDNLLKYNQEVLPHFLIR